LDAINVAVKDVVPLPRHFVDAVHIRRMKEMPLVNREEVGSAINLSGAGVNDPDGRIVFPARFQDEQLGPAIDVEIHKRIFHGVEVACLAGEVEQIVLTLDQVSHAEFIPYIGNVDADPAFIPLQIKEVSPILGDQAVYNRYPGTQLGQGSGQIASDEAQSPSDENALVGEILKIHDT